MNNINKLHNVKTKKQLIIAISISICFILFISGQRYSFCDLVLPSPTRS